jgi:membrane protein YqaA with SNARE-associated domain
VTAALQRPGPRLALRILLIGGVLAVVVWANLYVSGHDIVRGATQRFGYPGVFVAAAISGFNLLVPIPVIAFFPFFMEIGMAAAPTVVLIALGMTTGDLIGYLLGRTARGVVEMPEGGVLRRLESLWDRHPMLPFLILFLYAAFAPLPNELLVLPMAFLRYPVAAIFVAVLAGNMIFNTLVALGVLGVFELI